MVGFDNAYQTALRKSESRWIGGTMPEVLHHDRRRVARVEFIEGFCGALASIRPFDYKYSWSTNGTLMIGREFEAHNCPIRRNSSFGSQI
ncbi:MAG: hypothetical protein ACR2O1_07605, partial [Boseongicola sp.]